MVKLVDTLGSGSSGLKPMRVRVPLAALNITLNAHLYTNDFLIIADKIIKVYILHREKYPWQ